MQSGPKKDPSYKIFFDTVQNILITEMMFRKKNQNKQKHNQATNQTKTKKQPRKPKQNHLHFLP